ADTAATPAASQATAPPAQAVSAQVAAMGADQLREAASAALKEQRLYAPAGNNAMEYYLALRDKQPNDPAVASALTDLMPYTLIATEQSIARDDFVEAQRLYALMEKTDSTAPALKAAADQRAADQRAADQRAAQQRAAAQPAATQPAAATSTASASQQLRAISTPQPKYPPDAYRSGTSGEVEVEFTVGPDGSVTGARVVRASPPRVFDREALSAVKRWRFQPVGSPVTTRRTIGFNAGG